MDIDENFVLGFIITVGVIIISITGYNALKLDNSKKLYCGNVVEKFIIPIKSSSDPHIVFYSDSLKRNIDVIVNFNTYANEQIGETVCFILNDNEIR